MSHYTVAVFTKPGQSVEELLAPYEENMAVEPYIWLSRQEAIDYARKHYQTEGKSDEECWQMVADGEQTDEDGNIYSTYNPNSKWDWWTEGGRWGGMLRLHGEPADSGRVKDLEFPFDHEAYEHALRFWEVVIDHQQAKPDEEFPTFYTEEYYREHYGNRENYARQMAEFSTYAVVTPDGEWHAPGEIGWWGCSSETGEQAQDWYRNYKERFLDTADPDWTLNLIDCHI